MARSQSQTSSKTTMGSQAGPSMEEELKVSWPPRMWLWKSRLPAIVVPVLAGLGSLRGGPSRTSGPPPSLPGLELILLAAIAGGTGFAKLPFSVTWWFVLLAAFALKTELLLGSAVCLSLTVLLGWYGVRLCHPHAVSALWGGSRRQLPVGPWVRASWQVWDLFVHAFPALLVLYWHGPSLQRDGTLALGMATPLAVAATLPLNVLWLWGLGAAASPSWVQLRLWPQRSLTETNLVYRVAPELPWRAWLWIYGSHWLACGLWLACLLLPREMLFAFAVFLGHGLLKVPFTQAWWTTFLASLYGQGAYPLLEGICCCCAVTTAVGFYGTQLLVPEAFMSLVRAWFVLPLQRWAPERFSAMLLKFSKTRAFVVAARVADFCLHLFPTTLAACMFWRSVSTVGALAALPTNLMYWLATGYSTLAETNKIYGVTPPLSVRIWWFIYGSHWVLCGGILLTCMWSEAFPASA